MLWTGVCWDGVGGEMRKPQRRERRRAAGSSQSDAEGQTRGCTGEVVGGWVLPAPPATCFQFRLFQGFLFP